MLIDRKSTRLNSSHTVIYTLSLHDALPIFCCRIVSTGDGVRLVTFPLEKIRRGHLFAHCGRHADRSEEHTSELQSHSDLHSFPTRRSSDLLLPYCFDWRRSSPRNLSAGKNSTWALVCALRPAC